MTYPQASYFWDKAYRKYIADVEDALFFGFASAGIGVDKLVDMSILDLGCGTGQWMQRLILYGASPKRIVGIDNQKARIRAATLNCSANLNLLVGSGEKLPFIDNAFSLILQNLVFSSISVGVRHIVAKEMDRVLRPRGVILWVDFFSHLFRGLRRQNSNVLPIPIKRREVEKLFPSYTYYSKKFGLHRRLWCLYNKMPCLPGLLIKFPIFCGYEVVVLVKNGKV